MIFFTLLFFDIVLGLCPYLFTFLTLLGPLSYFDHLSSWLCDAHDNRWPVSFAPFYVNPWVLTPPFGLCATAWPRFFFIPILTYLIRLPFQLHGSKISFRLVPTIQQLVSTIS